MHRFGFLRRVVVLMLVFALGTGSTTALAPDNQLAGGVEGSINISDLSKLITAGSYVAGMGFAIAAVAKFKAHKDNPSQWPVGTPIALLFIAIALTFLPTIMAEIGKIAGGGGTTTTTGTEGFQLAGAAMSWSEPWIYELTPSDYAITTIAITSRILDEDFGPATKATLKNSLELLMTQPAAGHKVATTPEQRTQAVLTGALVGLKMKLEKLSRSERLEYFEVIGRATISELDEAGTPTSRIADDVAFLIGGTIAILHDSGFSVDEQAEMAGRLVKGAVLGLGGAGLPTQQEIAALRGLVSRAVMSLRRDDIVPKGLDQAARAIAAGAMEGVSGQLFSGSQYNRAAKDIALGTLDGLKEFLSDARWRLTTSADFTDGETLEDAWVRAINELLDVSGALRDRLNRAGERNSVAYLDALHRALGDELHRQERNRPGGTAEEAVKWIAAGHAAFLGLPGMK